ncbi:MoaD/ThiS family protein [Embleya sp. NPDC005575]|uniref:MoaD/ThiS family protein n=1 Tax=Embleya sp. NPDC005575 TaxID=3156892 RepID=UPI0033A478F3
MSVRLSVPAAWRTLLPGVDTDALTCEATTVGDALTWLTRAHPALGERLLHEGRIVAWTNVFIGEDNVRDLDGLRTPLPAAGATLTILPAMAGG